MINPYKAHLIEYVKKNFGKNAIEDSNTSNKNIIKVACILDKFSYECFKYEGDFVQLGTENWKSIIDSFQPDFLLVESAWEGYENQWINKIANLHKYRSTSLLSLIKYCNKQNIPTVFWAKEDPSDFEIFIEAAKHFNYIFTTDSDSIQKYKNIVIHDKIFLLPFAAQPKIHNPIDKDKMKVGDLAFAGGWYNKFPNRCIEMENILKPAFKYNLAIFDRFRDKKSKSNLFPKEYQPYIKGSLNYEDILAEYKKYNIFLNVNSVSNSSSTFSRRVFELLACGTPIISSYAKGIENLFGEIVPMSKSKNDTDRLISLLLSNKNLRDKLSTLGIREIFSHHTYEHRFSTILDKLNIENPNKAEEGVSVITCTKRPHSLKNIVDNYASQTYPVKELIIVINNDAIDLDLWKEVVKKYKDIKIYKLSEKKSLGECLNFAIDIASYPYISKFDDDDYYGPSYLIDIMNGFKYTSAGVVGKNTIYAYLERNNSLVIRYPDKEHQYVTFIAGSTLTAKKEIFKTMKFPHISRGEDTQFLIECKNKGIKVYSIDRFNHVITRRSDISSHSWQISEDHFMKNSQFVINTLDYKSITTV
ncbi:MAG: glycosyltransferase [Tissierellia bacterium]|nr:glycosyltransferase [Tissierellia bacterium]